MAKESFAPKVTGMVILQQVDENHQLPIWYTGTVAEWIAGDFYFELEAEGITRAVLQTVTDPDLAFAMNQQCHWGTHWRKKWTDQEVKLMEDNQDPHYRIWFDSKNNWQLSVYQISMGACDDSAPTLVESVKLDSERFKDALEVAQKITFERYIQSGSPDMKVAV